MKRFSITRTVVHAVEIEEDDDATPDYVQDCCVDGGAYDRLIDKGVLLRCDYEAVELPKKRETEP
jgi:hypothetical protein